MKTRIQFLFLGVAAGLALGTSAQAATIIVGEHSFEGGKSVGDWSLGGAAAGRSTGNVPAPWVDSGQFGSGWTISSQYTTGIPDGDIFAFANGGGSLSQTLTTVLLPNTTYTLTVGVGYRKDLPGLGFSFPGYGIELWAGSTKLASDYDAGHGGTGAATPASDQWKDAVITYTSPSSVTADALEIRLIGYGIQTNYDNVRLDGTLVPEPSTALLGGLGMLALLRRRRG